MTHPERVGEVLGRGGVLVVGVPRALEPADLEPLQPVVPLEALVVVDVAKLVEHGEGHGLFALVKLRPHPDRDGARDPEGVEAQLIGQRGV